MRVWQPCLCISFSPPSSMRVAAHQQSIALCNTLLQAICTLCSRCHLRLQAFCSDVLQQSIEKMPLLLHMYELPRVAMRYYWLQAHGHPIRPKLGFAAYTLDTFVAKYGSTEKAIVKWQQRWLQTPEGRLYGSLDSQIYNYFWLS